MLTELEDAAIQWLAALEEYRQCLSDEFSEDDMETVTAATLRALAQGSAARLERAARDLRDSIAKCLASFEPARLRPEGPFEQVARDLRSRKARG